MDAIDRWQYVGGHDGDRRQRGAALVSVEEITQWLGDPCTKRSSSAWWQYLGAVTALGVEGARDLARLALVCEAEGGLLTNDKSRRRTPGGIFFVLFRRKMGVRRSRRLRFFAKRNFELHVIKRFVRFLEIVLPPMVSELPPPVPTAAPAPLPPPERKAEVLPPVPIAPRATVAPGPPATPARRAPPRRAPAPVEVVIVRRRSS